MSLVTRYSLLFTALCLLFLGGCASVSSERQKEAEYHYKMGVSYMNEGNIQTAFVQLQKAMLLDPDNKDILNSLGLIYMHNLEEYDKARDLFLKAVEIDGNFSDAYNNLGVTYMRTGKLHEAIEAFKNALSSPLYQTPEWAFYNMGVSYYRLGQYGPAVDALKDAAKRSNSFPLPYFRLALVYNKTGRYGEASALISKALEMDPEYKGDRMKFMDEVKQKLLTAKGEEEADFRDYLEIMRY